MVQFIPVHQVLFIQVLLFYNFGLPASIHSKQISYDFNI